MNKVFFLMDHFKNPYAGTEGQLYALVKGLQKQNVHAEMAVFHHSDYTESGQFPCPVMNLNISKMFHIMTLIRLVKLALYCRRERFELIHIYFNDASVIAPLILRLFALKVIISRRDMGFWYTNNVLKILRLNAKFHQGCICNSEAVKKVTVEQENIPEQQVYVVYNGLPKNKIPASYYPHTEYQIGLVANIRPIKRFADLIRALKIVKLQVPDATVVFVGGGDSEQLELLAVECGVQDAVHFIGAEAQVTERIKKFQIAVLCSESEGLSNAIIEYMAHRKPVVCSNVGGNPELIEHGINGFLYPVGDIDALARYLLLLLQDSHQAEEFGQQGYEKIINHFTIDNMVMETLSIYHQVTQGKVSA